MYKVIIHKHKITFNQWDNEKQDWYEEDIKDSGPISKFFSKTVEIQSDVTVEDFMKHLQTYEQDIDFCFAGFTNGVSIKLFLEEMNKEPDSVFEVKEVQLFWFGEYLDSNLKIDGGLIAMLTKETAKEKGLDHEEPFGLEFIAINNWKTSPLKLNENVIIVDFGCPGDHEQKEEVILDGFKYWNLFEIISSFLYVLSENGSPKQREEKIAILESQKFDVDNLGTNKAQVELFQRYLQEEIECIRSKMEVAVNEEKFEVAAELKAKTTILKEELKKLNIELVKLNVAKTVEEVVNNG